MTLYISTNKKLARYQQIYILILSVWNILFCSLILLSLAQMKLALFLFAILFVQNNLAEEKVDSAIEEEDELNVTPAQKVFKMLWIIQ